ncbi:MULTISPECIES: protein kinase domain-containing protein [Sorangium]|uniref:Protein kinase n=1 Tax=Sorangium cellulosum TaxID=56 RepID=A0A4P2R1T9_SORCE|nr:MULTISPECIES: protein kinase [Sorangium]AUX36944.1 protein kinase [Sorangium cellulosum]WCQ96238.1 serine-threonine kinase [Sorangium sp. Soce836]
MVILGQEFAGYTIVASLDSPAPAEAYRALDADGREVTLYVQEDVALDAEAFRGELDRLLSLSPAMHGTVPVIAGGVEGTTGWIAARPSDDPSVEDLLPRLRSVAYELAVDVARALGAAHALGLAHGDVGPHTVVITGQGAAVLRAFGLHRLFGAPADPVADAARYRAPELFDARAIDPRTDVYGLGMLLYCVLGGRRPFEGRDDLEACALDEVPPPLQGVPAQVRDALSRALAKDPDARFQTVQELMTAVRPLLLTDSAPLAGGAPPPPGGAPPRPEPPPDTERSAPAPASRNTLPTGTLPPEAMRHPSVQIAAPRRRSALRAAGVFLVVALTSAAIAVPLSWYFAHRGAPSPRPADPPAHVSDVEHSSTLAPPVSCDPGVPAAVSPAVERPTLRSRATRRAGPASMAATPAVDPRRSPHQRWYGDQLF